MQREHTLDTLVRIQAKQIHAIETGDISALPARVYAIGFVKTYAEYLGLDEEKIVALFKAQYEARPVEKRATTIKAKQKPTEEAPVGAAVLLFVLLCAVLVALSSIDFGNKEPVETAAVPEVPKELKVETLKEKQVALTKPSKQELESADSKATSAPVEEKPDGIILRMVKNSWIEIRDKDGRKLISRVLNEGDQYFVPERLGLTISIGNAGGVQILVDGDPLQNLGKTGQVLRNIPLNEKALLARFPKAKPGESKALENEAKNQ